MVVALRQVDSRPYRRLTDDESYVDRRHHRIKIDYRRSIDKVLSFEEWVIAQR